MEIKFFDNPLETPRARAEVRFKQIGLFVYEDLRRVAIGIELTPFLERPCLDIVMRNEAGVIAGSMVLIESLSPNITMTMHLRDQEPTATYELNVQIYYDHPENKTREDYYRETIHFSVTEPGEQIFKLSNG